MGDFCCNEKRPLDCKKVRVADANAPPGKPSDRMLVTERVEVGKAHG
jgi:hypothetical protein